MTGKRQARLGTVQQTLFIPLAARARATSDGGHRSPLGLGL